MFSDEYIDKIEWVKTGFYEESFWSPPRDVIIIKEKGKWFKTKFVYNRVKNKGIYPASEAYLMTINELNNKMRKN